MILPEALAPYAALAVLAATFVIFVRDRHPPEMTALGALAAILGLGLLSPEQAFAAMANPAPVTIACMFVLSRAMVRAGLLEAVSAALTRGAAERRVLTLTGFAAVLIGASAVMNNTPVVVLMIPIAIKLAASLQVGASRLLIPVSYCAILGGACTMLGSSTNLLVDGVARSHGLEPFSLFEITPVGLAVAAAGLAYMALVGWRLLPDRVAPAEALSRRQSLRFMTELVIPEGSALIGARLGDVALFRREGVTVIDLIRGEDSLRRAMAGAALRAGDRVVLRTGVHELIDLREDRGLQGVDRVSQRDSVTVEALAQPGCRLIGRSLGRLRLRRRYGVYPLAAHRRVALDGVRLDDVVVRVGDALMLEGAPEDIDRLAEDVDLTLLSRTATRPYRREKAPLVAAIFAGVIGGAALGLAPLATLAILGVCAALFSRCLDPDEAYAAVDVRLLALILAMLGVGAALDRTGAVTLIATAAAPMLEGLPPIALLWAVILLTSVLTETVTNNAVAVVMTPVAIATAASVGLDPRPFVVGVMIAASASFATPIGYQTNTLVYASGGYRFADYLRIGAPLNLLVGVTAALVIPFVFPFGGG